MILLELKINIIGNQNKNILSYYHIKLDAILINQYCNFFLETTMSVKIIAEGGINHNGDINMAEKLIDVAAESGCGFIKFQKSLRG